jgi:uridine monophosphate synthetase
MKFIDKLNSAIKNNNSLLCVGLDPQEEMLPAEGFIEERLATWGERLVALTHDLVCCYKPNIAFFEQFGPDGLHALQRIVATIPEGMPILLDAKRGDIGSTADAYAKAAFQQWGADAVTLSPYLGFDSIKPFLADADRAVFILCQTSNPSAKELQQHGEPPLFEQVAETSSRWGSVDQIGLVVGATQPEALQKVRGICPDTWILAPGVGAQGADLQTALNAGLRSDRSGMLIPVSRGVILSSDPRASCMVLRDQINQARAQFQPKPVKSAKEELAIRLFEAGCVKFGSFTLASGKTSPIYIDLRRLVSFPDLFSRVASAYAEASKPLSFDLVSGVPYAALPISAVAALKLGKGLIYPRKEPKTHGTGQAIEGVFTPGQVALLYEDVITSGGSILTAAATLRTAGLIIQDVVVLVERSQGGRESLLAEGINLHAILNLDEILSVLINNGLIESEMYTQVTHYLEGSN